MERTHLQTDVPIKPAHAAAAFRVMHFERVQPDREQIHRLVHLQPGHGNHRRWFELVEQMLAEMSGLLRPRGLYRIDEVLALEPRRVVLASGAAFEGAVGEFLKHSHFIATFVVTIGSAVERLARGWLRAGKVMQGTIADAIASEAAPAAAACLKDEIRAWAQARGLDISPEYAPGYCGMSLEQQIPLFGSLPAHLINVRLTPSCLMLPVKSVSGLIGIGPADKVSPEGYPCEACDHPNCTQRRAPFDPDRGRCHDRSTPDACPPPTGQ